MSSVGTGAEIGILAASTWNNPEPEIVLAVSSAGKTVGATLGNDVNLRDMEGRSALLLGKAKDNNASCSIGPFIRLFDETFGIDDVRKAELAMSVEGTDGYRLTGSSSMSKISRDPLDLVSQAIGKNHQYPDGLVLFLGTMFAPVEDRDEPGAGFTHKIGDIVRIETPKLGALVNRVTTSDKAPPWTFGVRALVRNLGRARVAGEGLKLSGFALHGKPGPLARPGWLPARVDLTGSSGTRSALPLGRLQAASDHALFGRAGLDVLELMAGVQVAGDAGIRHGGAGNAGRLVAELLGVVLAGAQAEGLGTVGNGPQKVFDGRDRTVMQERRDRPDAVERPGLVDGFRLKAVRPVPIATHAPV